MRENKLLPSNGVLLKLSIMHLKHAKAVVLVLHGGPGSGAEVVLRDFAFQQLADSYTMVYYDQRGCGDSLCDLSKGIRCEDIVEDLNNVITYCRERFPEKPLYLWGGSFGSFLQLNYLHKYPKTVDKAIINSAALYPGGSDFKEAMFKIFQEIMPRIFPDELSETFEKDCTDMSGMIAFMKRPEVKRFLFSYEMPPRGLEGFWHSAAMADWMFDADIRSYLKELEVPSLIIQGMQDPFCPEKITKKAVEDADNPMISYIELDSCGHATFEDQPAQFVKACRDFLGNL